MSQDFIVHNYRINIVYSELIQNGATVLTITKYSGMAM